MIKLVVGLGNPGLKYQKTRHNIGWMLLDHLSFACELNWSKKFKGEYASRIVNNEKVYFLRPFTYMNLCGDSVLAIMNFFKIEIDEVLIVHDDLDFEFGVLTFKKGGGLAGHNGLKSIVAMIGSPDFHRIRLGISRPMFHSTSSWVLSEFSPDEKLLLVDFLNEGSKALEICLKEGYQKAAGRFSRKQVVSLKIEG